LIGRQLQGGAASLGAPDIESVRKALWFGESLSGKLSLDELLEYLATPIRHQSNPGGSEYSN
jgi:hypothetical protein